MDSFVWITFIRLRGIADLALCNLTVDTLRQLTDFGQVQDLIDMGLMFLDGGRLVIKAHLTEELAAFVEEELMHLAIDRDRPGGYREKRADLLEGMATYLPEGETIH